MTYLSFRYSHFKFPLTRVTIAQVEFLERREHEHDLEYAEKAVAKAADAVIRAECGSRLFRETEVLQAQLIAARVALRYLLGNNLIPEPENKAAETLLGYRQFPSFYGNVEWADYDRHQTTVAWKEVREVLSRDADASSLPKGGT